MPIPRSYAWLACSFSLKRATDRCHTGAVSNCNTILYAVKFFADAKEPNILELQQRGKQVRREVVRALYGDQRGKMVDRDDIDSARPDQAKKINTYTR